MDRIQLRDIQEEMRESYIGYAMSVIVSRALPDVRDGLKPVHRRILYAMNELNLDPTKAYKKSARIVGDTMGKYHPHGDASIYDALVRMAQDFSMRYMLVDGHGNFGSMDGDSAAAARYTEARLSRLSTELLADIEKNTIDFVDNYDGEFQEPSVLPARYPNLLVNGTSGIAVGMATNIPPHNLGEAVDALIQIIDNRVQEDRETEIEEIMDIVKGPDFPTGGAVIGVNGMRQAYRTGRGKIRLRGIAIIEPNGQREMIVITELPYQVNKARLIEKMADLVKEKRIEDISDIRDESDRMGIRVVVELKKDANSAVVLNKLYKYTQLEESFGVNMLAIVDEEPKVLNLHAMLSHYLEHQKSVVTRRTQFDLDRATKRAHILEGLLIALDAIDEVISIVRSSKDRAEARARLQERFGLTEEQATAIGEMRIIQLTGLEREKLFAEYNELQELIKELKAILADEKLLYGVIREELMIVRTKYADERRTALVPDESEIDYEDLIDEETCVITISHLGYIKRLPLSTYRSQNRGGKGIIGMQTRDEDLVLDVLIASTHDNMLFFTNKGRVYKMKAYEIPVSGRVAKGMALVNLLNLGGGEKVTAIMPIKEFAENEYIVMVTKNGLIKKTALSQFSNIRKTGIIALQFREDDELISIRRTDGGREIFVATRGGQGLRFSESEVRPMGRTASGVRAIRLAEGDAVVCADILDEDSRILFVSERGFGKCTDKEEFALRHRGGSGVKMYRITEKTGAVMAVAKAHDGEEIMMITSEGVIIRLRIADISTQSRVTQGVKLIGLNEDVTVVGIARIPEDYLEDEDEEDNGSGIESVEGNKENYENQDSEDIVEDAGEDEESQA